MKYIFLYIICFSIGLSAIYASYINKPVDNSINNQGKGLLNNLKANISILNKNPGLNLTKRKVDQLKAENQGNAHVSSSEKSFNHKPSKPNAAKETKAVKPKSSTSAAKPIDKTKKPVDKAKTGKTNSDELETLYKSYLSIVNNKEVNKLGITIDYEAVKSMINSSAEAQNKSQIKADYISVNAEGSKYSLSLTQQKTNKLCEAHYVNQHKTKGWSKLSIFTFALSKDDSFIQAYCAGFVEGIITPRQINAYFINKNEKNGFLNPSGTFSKVKNFFEQVDQNVKALKSESLGNKKNTHNLQLLLGYIQLLGLHDGYNTIAKTMNYQELSMDLLFIFQADGELPELRTAFNSLKNKRKVRLGDKDYFKENFGISATEPKEVWKELLKNTRCSAFIKLIKVGEKIKDIYLGHTAWGESIELLRIFKYHNFQLGKSSPIFPSFEVMFSAYPGTLSSTDDFYITSNKIAVTETTIEVADVSLYNKESLNVNKYIPNFMRVIASTRFSKSAKGWVDSFKKTPASTYSSQWLILDYKKIEEINNKKTDKDLFYVVEQLPGKFFVKDLTSGLLSKGYFGSYNKPFFTESMKALNFDELEKFYTKQFTTDSNRGKQFSILEKLVNSIETAMAVLRFNGYKQKIEGDPSNESMSTSISARYDSNGQYTPDFVGGIDSKITSHDLIKEMKVLTQSGPTGKDFNEHLKDFTYVSEKDKKVADILGINHSLSYPYLYLSRETMLKSNDDDIFKGKINISLLKKRK